MLAEERFALILDQLNLNRSVSVAQLCAALGASESTIRRDLAVLARQGRINKVHGGATLPDRAFISEEPTMQAKQEQAVSQKQCIGAAAAAMITAQDFIFLDAGSTTLHLVQSLSGAALQARFVTSGIAHARLLAQKGCRVYLPAGRIRPNTEAITGAETIVSLQRYQFTKAFLGANGIAPSAGFTTPGIEEALIKQTALARAVEGWFLADDTKFGKVYAAVIAPLDGAGLITNRLPADRAEQYTDLAEVKEAAPL